MRFPFRFTTFLTIFFTCVAGLAMAVTLVKGPEVNVAGGTAVVTWTTDVAAGTRLNYGTREGQLDQRLEGEVAAAHQVVIKDVKPGQTYFFSIGTARVQLATGSFKSGGSGTGAGAPKVPILAKKPDTTMAKPVPAPLPKPPPTTQTWGHLDSLQDHFNRHGADFKASSPDDYAARAWLFLQRAKRDGLPMKWDDSDDTLRVWEPATRTFAAYDRRGRTRTFFKPSNPDYWTRQPGRSVKAAELRF